MNKDDCYYLGCIKKPHGYKGEVLVFFDVDDVSKYSNLESVFIEINKKLVPFFVNSIKFSKENAIIKFEDTDESNVSKIFGCGLYLPLNMLPKLKGNKFYYHEVIGFSLVDKNKETIGIIESIIDYPAQAVFKTTIKNKEVLIPISDSIILKVDRENKTIIVDLPEGLLEIYF